MVLFSCNYNYWDVAMQNWDEGRFRESCSKQKSLTVDIVNSGKCSVRKSDFINTFRTSHFFIVCRTCMINEYVWKLSCKSCNYMYIHLVTCCDNSTNMMKIKAPCNERGNFGCKYALLDIIT